MVKCEFRNSWDTALTNRASPLPYKMQAKCRLNAEFPAPNTVKGLQEFLDMVMYYQCFLPRMDATFQLLFAIMVTKSKHIQWTDLMCESFSDTKKVLTQAVMLSHLQAGAPI